VTSGKTNFVEAPGRDLPRPTQNHKDKGFLRLVMDTLLNKQIRIDLKMRIRLGTQSDLMDLSEYWYDQVALLKQSNPRLCLLPNARRAWEQGVKQILARHDALFLVAETAESVVGAVLTTIEANQPGLAPKRFGLLRYFLIDLHAPQHGGVGAMLMTNLRTSLIKENIHHLMTYVSTQDAIQHAFWRGIGAKRTDDVFWMSL